MERQNRIFWVVFLLWIIVLLLIVVTNFQFFKELIGEKVEEFGLSAIFVFSIILEMILQPFSPDVPASIGVLLGINILFVFFAEVFGSFIGSLISFYLGRKVLSEKVVQSCSLKKYNNYCDWFKRYGKLALFVAALTPLPWVFFVWLSGAFHMKLKSFLLFGFLPRIGRFAFVLLFISIF